MRNLNHLALIALAFIGTLSVAQTTPTASQKLDSPRPVIQQPSGLITPERTTLNSSNQYMFKNEVIKNIPKKEDKSNLTFKGLSLGPDVSGGGDTHVLEFIRIAKTQIYPWLLKNGHLLQPKVDPETFINTLKTSKIASLSEVRESCDGSKKGREVEACYNDDLQMIYISKKRFPAGGELSSTRTRLVAHEIFRRMHLPEGDAYNLSIQIVTESRLVKTEYVQPEIAFMYTFSRQKKATDKAPLIPTIRRDFTEDGRVIFSLCSATYYRLTQEFREIQSCQLKGRAQGYPVEYVSAVFDNFAQFAYGKNYNKQSAKGVYSVGAGQLAGTGLGYGIGLALGMSNPFTAAAIGAVVGISMGFKMHDWHPNTASINLKLSDVSIATKQDNVVAVRAKTNMTMIEGFDQVIAVLDANLN